MDKKIIIIGAGPTGLGAAWRLQELGYENYKVIEKHAYPGGLAASFVDEKGFTWDVGGHVQFSHYKYFDDLMDLLMGKNWLQHERESWIWIKDRFVPYPFQNNLRYLPKEDLMKCLSGLVDIYQNPIKSPENFEQWILATLGSGVAELFMTPYNYKVWAYKPAKMSYRWIGERVAVADLKRVLKNIIYEQDDVSWGPNNKFRFPARGGTGEIWRQLYSRLAKEKFEFSCGIKNIDVNKKSITTEEGKRHDYDMLISTMPLDLFLECSNFRDRDAALLHSSTHIIGLGLEGKPPEHLRTKCWMYFPEDNCPFYRVTVFSNYSPHNVPDIKRQWSLMLEVSESTDKPVNHEKILEETIQGALNTKLIKSRKQIIDKWHHFEEYGYPTPSLGRDDALGVLKRLEKHHVYSRGRFGAWKYEVANMDHSLMQGVEVVNRLLKNEDETTVWHPEIANKR